MTVDIQKRLDSALAALRAIEQAADKDFSRLRDGGQPLSDQETLSRVRRALADARHKGLLVATDPANR